MVLSSLGFFRVNTFSHRWLQFCEILQPIWPRKKSITCFCKNNFKDGGRLIFLSWKPDRGDILVLGTTFNQGIFVFVSSTSSLDCLPYRRHSGLNETRLFSLIVNLRVDLLSCEQWWQHPRDGMVGWCVNHGVWTNLFTGYQTRPQKCEIHRDCWLELMLTQWVTAYRACKGSL